MANAADPSIGKGADGQRQVERSGHGVQRYAYANAVDISPPTGRQHRE
jgi:hypothetical protein